MGNRNGLKRGASLPSKAVPGDVRQARSGRRTPLATTLVVCTTASAREKYSGK